LGIIKKLAHRCVVFDGRAVCEYAMSSGSGLVFVLEGVVGLLFVLVLYKSYEACLRDAGFE